MKSPRREGGADDAAGAARGTGTAAALEAARITAYQTGFAAGREAAQEEGAPMETVRT